MASAVGSVDPLMTLLGVAPSGPLALWCPPPPFAGAARLLSPWVLPKFVGVASTARFTPPRAVCWSSHPASLAQASSRAQRELPRISLKTAPTLPLSLHRAAPRSGRAPLQKQFLPPSLNRPGGWAWLIYRWNRGSVSEEGLSPRVAASLMQ